MSSVCYVSAGSDEALISARTSELIKVRREYELARFDLVRHHTTL